MLATGHYARIVERQGRLLLARGVDEGKDQSYMLASVDPALLGAVWFPLGESRKDEIRAEAARAGLAAAHRAESQEACFLAGDDYRVFLQRRGVEPRTGPIVERSGTRARLARRSLAVHARPAARPRGRRRASAVRDRN